MILWIVVYLYVYLYILYKIYGHILWWSLFLKLFPYILDIGLLPFSVHGVLFVFEIRMHWNMILMYYNLVSVSFHNPEIHVCLRPGLDIRFSLDMLLHISRNAYRISHLGMQLLDMTGRTGLYSSIETILHYNLILFRNCYWYAWSCYTLGTTALFLLLSLFDC